MAKLRFLLGPTTEAAGLVEKIEELVKLDVQNEGMHMHSSSVT